MSASPERRFVIPAPAGAHALTVLALAATSAGARTLRVRNNEDGTWRAEWRVARRARLVRKGEPAGPAYVALVWRVTTRSPRGRATRA